MISLELAQQLLAGGLVWEPQPGDRFAVPGRDMDDESFVVSQMTVDVHDYPQGRVIGFNGTTEWTMDSLELTEVLWLPSEGRLREELGPRFAGLWRDGDDWVVAVQARDDDFPEIVDPDARVTEFRHADAESAYALAMISVLDF